MWRNTRLVYYSFVQDVVFSRRIRVRNVGNATYDTHLGYVFLLSFSFFAENSRVGEVSTLIHCTLSDRLSYFIHVGGGIFIFTAVGTVYYKRNLAQDGHIWQFSPGRQ